MDLVFCFVCGRMFDDTDDTGVCPSQHETRWYTDDSDEDGNFIPARKVVG